MIGHMIVKLLLHFTQCNIIAIDTIQKRCNYFKKYDRVTTYNTFDAIDVNIDIDTIVECTGNKFALFNAIHRLVPYGLLVLTGFYWKYTNEPFYTIINTIMTKKIQVDWVLSNRDYGIHTIITEMNNIPKFGIIDIRVSYDKNRNGSDETHNMLYELANKRITTISGWENYEPEFKKDYFYLLENKSVIIDEDMYEIIDESKVDECYYNLENNKDTSPLTYIIKW